MNKKNLVLIHNGPVLVEQLEKICAEIIPDVNIINIVDSSMVRDIIEFKDHKIGTKLTRRIARYALCAEDLGADAILMTCSSLCGTVDIADKLTDVPMYKIIKPMAEEAVQKGKKIGLIATLESSIWPTKKQVFDTADKLYKTIEVKEYLCNEAFKALISGNRDKHDEMLEEASKELAKECDVIVLAQGSMAGMTEKLIKLTGKPVLSCLESGIKQLKQVLQ